MLRNLFLVPFLIYLLKAHDLNEEFCEPLRGECTDQGYSYTSRFLSQHTSFGSQQAADSIIQSFEILLPCSNYLKIFLCGSYKPSCYQDAALIIRPCKSMCEHVYSRCFPLMDKFKKKWNDELNCSKFLDDSSQRCMNDEGYKKDLSLSSKEYLKQLDFLFEKEDLKPQAKSYDYDLDDFYLISSKTPSSSTKSSQPKTNEYYICFRHQSSDLFHLNKTFLEPNKCVLKCNMNILFNSNQKHIAHILSLVSHILCIVFSLSNILCLIRKQKNQFFPLNALFFISICLFFYSLIQLISIYIGRNQITCQDLDISQIIYTTDKNPIYMKNTYKIALEKAFENGYCALSILLGYYFRMCLCTWWLIMALSWYLIVQFEISPKNLIYYGNSYFHFLSWILPFFKTLIILIFRTADTSELTGTCSVGNSDKDTLFKFLILPSGVYLFLAFF